jgi:uncharacterized protein with von Willebrand factor type A (vWA) domain
VKVWRYSRWDGTQREFTLDAKQALDALSELLMEGLSVDEALEWMRRGGFPLAGMNFRVMGTEELVQELRRQARELMQQYAMNEATDELAQKLDGILDREERAQRAQHGMESAALNQFLERRHREHASLADAIEAFRDHAFQDEEAGEAFQELLQELDRLRALENFLQQHGGKFSGPEQADYETAQQVREQIEALERMAKALAAGHFEEISLEQLREMLGDDAGQSLILLRDLDQNLRDSGFLREGEGGLELTPRAIRRIGAQALASVYSQLRKGRPGSHDTVHYGVATRRPDETRPWAFGDALDLHVVRTMMNAVTRRAASGQPPTPPLRLIHEDLEVYASDYTTQTTTVLLLDMSWSMSWAGRFRNRGGVPVLRRAPGLDRRRPRFGVELRMVEVEVVIFAGHRTSAVLSGPRVGAIGGIINLAVPGGSHKLGRPWEPIRR